MNKRALLAFISLFAAGMSGLVWISCSIEQPRGEDTQFVHADHADTNACTDCHESDRPTPEHGKGSDCGVCHESKDDKETVFTPKAGITSSGQTRTSTETASETNTSSSTNTETTDPTKVHEHPAGLTSCVACHEKDRAPPPHVKTGECAACHEPSNTGGPWKPK